MAPVVGHGWRRLVAPHVTIDESTAVALASRRPAARRTGFWITGVGIYVGWNLSTLGGALLGDVLGDPRTYGLDAAAAAAFLRCCGRVCVAARRSPSASPPPSSPPRSRPCSCPAFPCWSPPWSPSPWGGPTRSRAARHDDVDGRARGILRLPGAEGARVRDSRAVVRRPAPSASIDLLTVALLAALVAVQTLGAGPQIVVDARVPAIIVAAGRSCCAPFLVVVVAAAVVAALLRRWGGPRRLAA
jgi:hypothetical protein